MASLIVDIVFDGLIITAFIVGLRKGLIKSVWKFAAWIITAVVVFVLIKPATDFVMNTPVHDYINNKVYLHIQNKMPDVINGESFKNIFDIPQYFNLNVDINEGFSDLSQSITLIIIKALTVLGLFVILRILLAIIFKILNITSKLPVINGTNKLLGGVFGVINMLFVIYIVCAVLTIFSLNERAMDIINSSYIVKYFYNNNILMQFLIRI